MYDKLFPPTWIDSKDFDLLIALKIVKACYGSSPVDDKFKCNSLELCLINYASWVAIFRDNWVSIPESLLLLLKLSKLSYTLPKQFQDKSKNIKLAVEWVFKLCNKLKHDDCIILLKEMSNVWSYSF